MDERTGEEQLAIDTLEKLRRHWPWTLWLYAADSMLYVMRCDGEGRRIMTDRGGVDPDYIVTTVDIPSGGGDW